MDTIAVDFFAATCRKRCKKASLYGRGMAMAAPHCPSGHSEAQIRGWFRVLML